VQMRKETTKSLACLNDLGIGDQRNLSACFSGQSRAPVRQLDILKDIFRFFGELGIVDVALRPGEGAYDFPWNRRIHPSDDSWHC
jgi:hypothetical protein